MRAVTLGGAVLGFVTLDPMVAGPLGVILLGVTVGMEKLNYYLTIMHVMQSPSEYVLENRLGSAWAKDDESIIFAQLFSTKRAAKEAYAVLKAWNFGSYIDENNNIILSVVDEGDGRYVIFLMPGDRGIDEHHKASVPASLGARYHARVQVLKIFFMTFADYRDSPEKQQLVAAAVDGRRVRVSCFWTKGDEVIDVAKRHFVVAAQYRKRSDVKSTQVESRFPWTSPIVNLNEHEIARFKRLSMANSSERSNEEDTARASDPDIPLIVDHDRIIRERWSTRLLSLPT